MSSGLKRWTGWIGGWNSVDAFECIGASKCTGRGFGPLSGDSERGSGTEACRRSFFRHDEYSIESRIEHYTVPIVGENESLRFDLLSTPRSSAA